MNDRPEALREVIARHGLSASKALGQNFILDRQLLARIAAVPGPLEGQTVYEVGPGPGGLTRALLDAGARVVAVERDIRCLVALEDLRREFPDALTILHGDALQIDEIKIAGRGAHVVANLPYNVGTALFVRWLDALWPPWWASLTLMFQKEVADRIVASAGTSAYGRLSIAAQWRAAPRIMMSLGRSAFVPPPKVASAIVHVTPSDAPEGVDPKILERVTRAAFGQRRKMLRSSLKTFPQAIEQAEHLGIDVQRRAETVRVDEWIALARALS